jgi:hypothetical protein
VSARGAKSCALLDAANKVCFTLGSREEPTSTPFGATVFGDEPNTRKTIEFNLSPEQEESFAKFDRWSVTYLAMNSQRLFKKEMSEEQIRENYKSPLTKNVIMVRILDVNLIRLGGVRSGAGIHRVCESICPKIYDM